MARPSLLNDRVVADLVQAVGGGSFYEEAAAYAGVSERSLFRWLQRGRNYDEVLEAGGEPAEDDKPFGELYRRLRKARADTRVGAVGVVMAKITATGPFEGELPDANLAMKFLERVDPERWGRVWRQNEPQQSEAPPDAETLAARAEHLLDELAAKRAEREQEGTVEAATP